MNKMKLKNICDTKFQICIFAKIEGCAHIKHKKVENPIWNLHIPYIIFLNNNILFDKNSRH